MSWNITPFLFVSLLIACLSCCQADLIGSICAKTLNPSFCNKFLRSDPRAVNAKDARSLGFVAINKAHASAKSAQGLVASLAIGATVPRLKAGLIDCEEYFSDAAENLHSARASLRKNDKGSLNIQASAAQTDADTCNDSFASLGQDEPPNVKEAAQNVIDSTSIVVAISNTL